jgi:hypothetical protein
MFSEKNYHGKDNCAVVGKIVEESIDMPILWMKRI